MGTQLMVTALEQTRIAGNLTGNLTGVFNVHTGFIWGATEDAAKCQISARHGTRLMAFAPHATKVTNSSKALVSETATLTIAKTPIAPDTTSPKEHVSNVPQDTTSTKMPSVLLSRLSVKLGTRPLDFVLLATKGMLSQTALVL